MAAETLRPDGQLGCAGLVTCDFLEHDDDPDVSSVTIDATGNNTNTEYGVDFPTPSGNPTAGAGLQEFRAGVIEFDPAQTGTPTARIELWENGALVRAGADTDVSVYAVLAFTWNANELATADGSLVQCKVIGTRTGGGPSKRNTVRVGHIEYNAEVDTAAVTGDGSSSGSATVTADGVSTAAADGSSDGVATASGDGASTFRADGSAAGASTVSGDSSNIQTGDGSSAGVASVSADGISTSRAPGSSAGIATITGGGVSTAAALGSSAGVTAVTADGASKIARPGTGAGTSTVTGDGKSTFAAPGTGAGTSTVSGAGVAKITAVGDSAAASTVTGDGVSTFSAPGSAAGAATATAEGQEASPRGTAAGVATVTGAGAFTERFTDVGEHPDDLFIVVPMVAEMNLNLPIKRHVIGFRAEIVDAVHVLAPMSGTTIDINAAMTSADVNLKLAA